MTAHQQNIGWTKRAQENAEAIRDMMGLDAEVAKGRAGWRSKVILAAVKSWADEVLGRDERAPMDTKSLRIFLQQYVEDTWDNARQVQPNVNIYLKDELIEDIRAVGRKLETLENVPFLKWRRGEDKYNVTMIVQVALMKYRRWLEMRP